MNDLQPFKHGEEGTHSVCNKHNIGGKSVCCECSGKTGCSDVPNDTLKEKIEEAVREFQGMRPLVSSVGDQKARQALQDILDMWWKDAAVYKDWLRTTLTTLIDQAREEEENRLLNEIINNFGAFAAFGQDELNDFSLLAKEVKEQVSEQAVAEERVRGTWVWLKSE